MDLIAHIRIFIEIADRGSLAKVARARSLAPSAVTASLRRLEEHVGTRLVLRSTRSLALTSAGERFVVECRQLVQHLDEAIERVAGDGPLRGLVRLTSINDFGRSRLSHLIDGFIALHPQVQFELSLSDEVVDLVEGGYDLGIRTGPLSDSRLRTRLIVRCGRSVCAAPAYWDRCGRPRSPSDLVDHNCLIQSRRGAPQSVWHFMQDGAPITVHIGGDRMANDGGMLRQWAISGAGVVLKSDYDIAQDLEAGRLETVLDRFKLNDMNLYAVHAAGRQVSRRTQAFMDYLANGLHPDR
ncbi:LysR family transcriptional regulator [Novosphingobium guangzhouense]|uniref:LysR family transcriptional regulator n=2 Tax=Novosphingobium guangzhouense TaxID=1850347 RepID=A0A2K2G5W2_9SPHN|nr:LysR family transcriptional regulator [Novosphingobium guangzhouense]